MMCIYRRLRPTLSRFPGPNRPENRPVRNPIDLEKVRAIVETDIPERMESQPKGTRKTKEIADHLFNFLELEVQETGKSLPPFKWASGASPTPLPTHSAVRTFGI
jgi:hypothetical protein